MSRSCPTLTTLGITVLDESALFEVTYSGVPNVASFQRDSLVTAGGHQYTAWYGSDRGVRLSRRAVEGYAVGPWQTFAFDHDLSAVDSHNTISLGVSRGDGRLHVAMDTHDTPVYYTVSHPHLVDGAAPWGRESFAVVQRTLGGVDLGGISYPQFVGTPAGGLLLSYRTGHSGGGVCELAEYDPTQSKWTTRGAWTGSTGRYVAPNGRTNHTRNAYLHGLDLDRNGRLHAAFTWRESARGGTVLSDPGGLANHDTGYVYSDDLGSTWYTDGGELAARTGGDLVVSWGTPGHVVDALGPDHALINQESQAVDSAGRPHVMISYVPPQTRPVVSDFVTQRRDHARPVHLVRVAHTWQRTELGVQSGRFGRTQLVIAEDDTAYAVLPDGRVAAASAAANWLDWSIVFDGAGVDSFTECTVDRSRLRSGVLSVMFQEPGQEAGRSPLRVIDLAVGA
ncbi:BNR repeat-containing protein [Williamsia sp. CHRR-6]|uniref:BNR repeat-containing protein n=1 Tax=Williamsia sp. CHRR-6 TaxID=2835871 RepID=UPI001BD91E59|nr:BNR repeat-containing protein [Williamsia sp. CHRR-6]MBT0567078.1 BNR repeat-containing protein [Williamsia sp. CHRR-6]